MKYRAIGFLLLGLVLGGCCHFETPGPEGSNIIYRVDKPTIKRCKVVSGQIDATTCEQITLK